MLRLVERQGRVRYRVAPALHQRSAVPHTDCEAEMRLIREMRVIYALHDLYWSYVAEPLPQHLMDLVVSPQTAGAEKR